ncbi:MAG: nucleotidyltransferase domain-containing protein [Planctomycetota bacterium]
MTLTLKKLSDAEIRQIVERIRGASDPDRIILFGSAAREELSSGSDVDLLVLFPEALSGDLRALRDSIRRSLNGLGLFFDVLTMLTKDFDRRKPVFGCISHTADKEGKVIYVR